MSFWDARGEGYYKDMATSKSQIKAVTKYESKVYDKILIRLTKDGKDGYPTRDEMSVAASSFGMSLNIFVKEAIKEKMDRMSGKA